jgi:hypothetical protein
MNNQSEDLPRETDVDYDEQDAIMLLLGNASYHFFEEETEIENGEKEA